MAKVQKFEELKIWQIAREVAKCLYDSPKSKDATIKMKSLKPETFNFELSDE